jgi:hypothetical protein
MTAGRRLRPPRLAVWWLTVVLPPAEREPFLGDPATLAAAAGLLVVAALGACVMPASRATRIDQLEAMRE